MGLAAPAGLLELQIGLVPFGYKLHFVYCGDLKRAANVLHFGALVAGDRDFPYGAATLPGGTAASALGPGPPHHRLLPTEAFANARGLI